MRRYALPTGLVLSVILCATNGLAEPQEVSGSVLIGVSSTSGNTDTSSVFARAELKLSEVIVDGKPDPLAMKAEYQLAERDGEMTARRGQGQLRYDHEFIKKTSAFFLERVSFDEFQNLDLRAEEQLGLSRKLIEQKQYGLSADAGLTRIDSFYETAENQGDFGLVLGGHAFWNVVGSLKLTEDVEYRPAFGDFNQYLFTSETALSTRLSENWQVKLLYQIFYNSTPQVGTKGTDKNLMLTLGYTF